jgi:hypothetical protein
MPFTSKALTERILEGSQQVLKYHDISNHDATYISIIVMNQRVYDTLKSETNSIHSTLNAHYRLVDTFCGMRLQTSRFVQDDGCL